jgi:hypothetical protein
MRNLWAAFLTLLSAAALSAQKYAVHLSPPVPSGQVFTVSATGSELLQTSIGDRVLKKTEYRVTFVGRASVLEIDTKQRPLKIAFTVERFTKTEGGVANELLKPGMIILADGSQKSPISLRDGSLEEPAREAFGLVYSTHTPGDATDDEVFGTPELRAVGERWPMNSGLASESLKKSGMAVSPEHLSGTVSILATDRVGGIDCLNIRGEMQSDGFVFEGAPSELTATHANMSAVFSGCYPSDVSKLSHREGADLTMRLALTSKEGVTLDMSMHTQTDALWLASRN